jgi:hypothetical protein
MTSATIDLQKGTTLFLAHMPRGEMRFPMLSLIWCKLTAGRLKRRVDGECPQEFIEFAALPLWVYINLQHNIGGALAFEIMRVVILTGGIAQWNLAYRAATGWS